MTDYYIIEHPTRGTLREFDSDTRTGARWSHTGSRDDPETAMRFNTAEAAFAGFDELTPLGQLGVDVRSSANWWMPVSRPTEPEPQTASGALAGLTALVQEKLHGATLTAWELHSRNETEYQYVVRWVRDREAGTHIALLPTDRSMEGVLLWGYYFHGEEAGVQSMISFLSRTGLLAASQPKGKPRESSHPSELFPSLGL